MTKFIDAGDEDNHRCICITNNDQWDDGDEKAIEMIEKAVLEKYGVTNDTE
jgi:hypothetical protein